MRAISKTLLENLYARFVRDTTSIYPLGYSTTDRQLGICGGMLARLQWPSKLVTYRVHPYTLLLTALQEVVRFYVW